MFSGIVEEMATVVDIKRYQGNIDFTLTCSFARELGIDQSMSVHRAFMSTCPCTMWPSSLPFIIMERSTFTRSPTSSSPKLERSSVSFIAVTT